MCTNVTPPESDTWAMQTLDSLEQLSMEDKMEYYMAKDSATKDAHLYQGKPSQMLGMFDPDGKLEKGLDVLAMGLELQPGECRKVEIQYRYTPDEGWRNA